MAFEGIIEEPFEVVEPGFCAGVQFSQLWVAYIVVWAEVNSTGGRGSVSSPLSGFQCPVEVVHHGLNFAALHNMRGVPYCSSPHER